MKQMSLIEGMNPEAAGQPLASRMRPRDLSEFVGQEHLVGEGKLLRQMIERDQNRCVLFEAHFSGILPEC